MNWVKECPFIAHRGLHSKDVVENSEKAFVNAIYTTKTTMNTKIKGQDGYKKNDFFDRMSEAEKMYQQYKWIIK